MGKKLLILSFREKLLMFLQGALHLPSNATLHPYLKLM